MGSNKKVVPLPSKVLWNNITGICNALMGPCSCGYTHDIAHVSRVLSAMQEEIDLLHEDLYLQKTLTTRAVNKYLAMADKKLKKQKSV